MSVSHVVTKPLAAILRALNTRYADSTLRGLQAGKLPAFPCITESSVDFAKDYLAYNLCRKVRDPVMGFVPPTEDQLVQEAVSGFLEVEEICALVNRGAHPGWVEYEANTLAPEAVLHTAQRKIFDLLGEFDLNEFAESIDFSNGASTRLPRRRAAVPHKFTGKPHVTRNCAFLAMNLIWYHEPWRLYCQERFGRESDPCTWVEVVRGSTYFTVPKTATKLRGAAKEAELNMLCQKALGSMLRRRLRHVRVDLNDQSRNRMMALQGSRTGSLATIDLSNASDSVSLICLELLPESWRNMFMMTRSEEVQLPDGTWHRLAKVSSMGNGFNFELESLIFWALAASCVDLLQWQDRRVGVYGDDIIVHHVVAPHLLAVLSYLGFIPNADKTFISGPFRESCGGHYHYGVDVTPFFLRTGLDSLEDKYHFLNSLNQWHYRFPVIPAGCHRYVHNSLLTKEQFVFVPPHLGTKCGLIAPSIQVVPRIYFCLRRQAYALRIYTATARSRKMQSAPGYLAWLLGSIHGRLGEVLIPKTGVVKHRFKRVFTSEWSDACVAFPSSLLDL